jgi:hypothetical protein
VRIDLRSAHPCVRRLAPAMHAPNRGERLAPSSVDALSGSVTCPGMLRSKGWRHAAWERP